MGHSCRAWQLCVMSKCGAVLDPTFMSGICHAEGDKLVLMSLHSQLISPHLCRAHVVRETMPVCIVIVLCHTQHPLDVFTITCALAHMCAAPHHATVQLHCQRIPSHPHDYQTNDAHVCRTHTLMCHRTHPGVGNTHSLHTQRHTTQKHRMRRAINTGMAIARSTGMLLGCNG